MIQVMCIGYLHVLYTILCKRGEHFQALLSTGFLDQSPMNYQGMAVLYYNFKKYFIFNACHAGL